MVTLMYNPADRISEASSPHQRAAEDEGGGGRGRMVHGGENAERTVLLHVPCLQWVVAFY